MNPARHARIPRVWCVDDEKARNYRVNLSIPTAIQHNQVELTIPKLVPAVAISVAAAAVAAGCVSSGPYVNPESPFLTERSPAIGDSVTTFFALGDWGTGKDQERMVAGALKLQIEGLPSNRAARPFVVGLGDNVYEYGLKSGWGNPETASLLEQSFGEPFSDLKWEDSTVDFFVVPGNHDYGAGFGTGKRKSGYGDVIHQETTAEGAYEGYHYFPLNYPGKPDSNDEIEYDAIRHRADSLGQVVPLPESMTRPEVVPPPPSAPITIIAIDTQAMIERQSERGDRVNDPTYRRLDSLLASSDQPWKFVLGHHPIQTFGGHGQHPTVENWLWSGTRGKIEGGAANGFRLTLLTGGVLMGALVSPAGWIAAGVAVAMPAMTVIFDEIHKHPEDLDHWAYKTVADSLQAILGRHDTIYLSGHDHNLQLIALSDHLIQVVSGSASKLNWVASSGDGLQYSVSKPGFARFDLTSRTLWVRYCTVEDPGSAANCGPTFEFHK